MLKHNQEMLGIPLSQLVQEVKTRWWSIIMMIERIIKNYHAVTLALANNDQSHLILTQAQKAMLIAIVELLEPFKYAGEKLSSENDVTISCVVPMFDVLKEHLRPNKNDIPLISNMKRVMLVKLNNRYSENQMKVLYACTLLDVRYKQRYEAKTHFLHEEVSRACNQSNTQESQDILPPTQGQEIINLSNFVSSVPRNNSGKSKILEMFEFRSDDVNLNAPVELNELEKEIKMYMTQIFSKQDKSDINILKWWQCNKNVFPLLYKAARSLLLIPATSVSSERIFSLAGYVVRKRRSKLLPEHVNKLIFLKKNMKFIPEETTVYAISEAQ